MCKISPFLFSILFLFSTSCSFQKPDNRKVLRLGYMPNVTHGSALVGIEQGFFKEELGNEINFKPLHFVVGNSIIDAFITEQIDAAYVGPGPFINAVYRKVPIKFLSGACNGGTVIVGATGRLPLQTGLRIAVPQYGNTQDLILRSYLEKKELLDKVKILAIPAQDTGTAFFTMSIDASCLPEPWGTILIEKNVCKLLVNEKEILNRGNYPVTILVVSKNFANDNPSLVEKLLIANKKINDYINANSEESINVVKNAIEKISKKEIDKGIIVESFKRCTFSEYYDLNIIKEFKAIGIKSGYYRKGFLNENIID